MYILWNYNYDFYVIIVRSIVLNKPHYNHCLFIGTYWWIMAYKKEEKHRDHWFKIINRKRSYFLLSNLVIWRRICLIVRADWIIAENRLQEHIQPINNQKDRTSAEFKPSQSRKFYLIVIMYKIRRDRLIDIS